MMLKKLNRIFSIFGGRPITTIVVVALLVRLLIVVLYQHITIYPDTEDYVLLASKIMQLDLTGYEGQRSPGYPLLLSLSAGIYFVTIFLQTLLGIFTLILTYKTLLLLSIGKKVSLVVTICVACYIPIIYFELTILTETLTLFLITSVFYLFFKIVEGRVGGWRHYLVLAIICGYLVLTKPFYIFLAFLLFGFLILKKFTFRLLIRYSLILLIPFSVFVGWSYVNKANTGYFVSTTFYGFNLAQNCVSFAENTTEEYKDIGQLYAGYRDSNIAKGEGTAMSIWDAFPELEERTQLSFPDLSDKLYNYSRTTIELNKRAYLEQVFISWRDFWKTSLYYEYDGFAVQYSNVLVKYFTLLQRVFLQLVKILFVLLIPYNLYRFVRRRSVTPSLVISTVVLAASLLQAMVTYGTNSRFSFPFEVLIVVSVLLNCKAYYSKKLLGLIKKKG